MVIWLLLIVFVLLLILSYLLCKKDIMQPSVIFCAVYVISILCAIYNIDNWGIDLGWGVFAILVLGAIEFLLINFVVNKYFNKKYGRDELGEKVNQKEIIVKKWKVWLVIIYDLIAIIVLLAAILKIAGEYGKYDSLSKAINIYKDHTSYRTDTVLPGYVSLLIKPIEVFAYICAFIFIRNLFFAKGKISYRIKKNFPYIIPMGLAAIRFMLTSTRGSILQLFVGIVFFIIICWYDKTKWERKFPFRKVVKFGLLSIGVLVVFYFSGIALQRRIKVGAVDYLTMYAGGSIVTFDAFLKTSNPPSSSFPGSETFPSITRRLYQIGAIEAKKLPTVHLEWRYANGRNIGNVYTAYRRWLNDFGYVGMFALNAVMALYFAFSYNLIKYRRKKVGDVFIIVYMYLLYYLFMHSIVSIFYNTVFSAGFILFVVVLYVGYKWITGDKIIKKKRSLHND